MVQFKIVDRGTRYLDSVCMSHKTLESYLHLFTLAQRLFDKVRLTLQENQLSTWVDILGIVLGQLVFLDYFEQALLIVFLFSFFILVRYNLTHQISHLNKVWTHKLWIVIPSIYDCGILTLIVSVRIIATSISTTWSTLNHRHLRCVRHHVLILHYHISCPIYLVVKNYDLAFHKLDPDIANCTRVIF